MIERLTNFPSNVVAFICKGRVTRLDYDAVLVPAVQRAFQTHDKIRLDDETGPDFAGFDLGAAWEDLKVGIGHFTRWERVAVVTDVEWIKHSAHFFGFLMPVATRVFSAADTARARAWICAG